MAPEPFLRINGTACLDIRNTLLTFTAKTSSHVSGEVDSTVP